MVNPFLVVLAAVFYVTPLVLAIVVDRQTAAFQREAFGHLQKAARNLRFMTWVVFLYYVGVLVGSAIIGDLAYMWESPIHPEGLQIYIRIGAAIVAYIFAMFVARELYEVTVPQRTSVQ